MIDKNRLVEKSVAVFPKITECIEEIELYSKLLVEYNKKVNLTAITQPCDMEDKHFVDCLHLAANTNVRGSVCDVGSGAGFPGLVLAIARPDLTVTLMEPTKKRCVFLQHICDELGIKAEIVSGRAEELGRKAFRERFDTVTARAVASLPTLLEYCVPLCKVGGVIVAMKGEAEGLSDGTAAKTLGADGGSEVLYNLPAGDFRRLLIYNKIKQTPPKYPRSGGKTGVFI